MPYGAVVLCLAVVSSVALVLFVAVAFSVAVATQPPRSLIVCSLTGWREGLATVLHEGVCRWRRVALFLGLFGFLGLNGGAGVPAQLRLVVAFVLTSYFESLCLLRMAGFGRRGTDNCA